MSGPAGVMALVLAESAAGAAAILFLTPLWNEVRRGFFFLTGAVVLALAAGAGGAGAGAFAPSAGSEGRLAVALALAMAGATLAWLILLAVRAGSVARILGILSVPLSVAMLVAFARTVSEPLGSTVFQLLAGALFTGAVLDGLLLGHWYLTDRKLTRGPINRAAWLLIGAVVAEAAGVIAGVGSGNEPGAASKSINPLLTVGGSASWIAIGMVLCTGLIAVFIRLTLRGIRPTAVQSATGFFYLAVITAFTAEIAAKVRFLP
ncbi:MAG: hypothetical protein E6G44_01015 [Actinobacteria bacterium]|nr:MAG: hypothetical protein E6G44_01015 [Actinomycetota bacterium]